MILLVRNFNKLLLTALLIGAVGTMRAQDFSTGLFSVSPTKQVQFATQNLPGFYTWTEAMNYNLLSEEEWHYLLQSRANAYQLYALGAVDGTNGLIILPDYETWEQPAGVAPLDVDHTQDGFEKNTYSAADWALLAAEGAVFLPAAGYSTDGLTPINAGTHGSYWIGTESSVTYAYRLQFEDNLVSEMFTMPKTNYYSVRTVQASSDPIKLSEYDQPEVFVAKKAALSEETTVGIYRTLRKAGCFNTLTLPFHVPDIAASPLAGAEVYEFVGATIEDGTLQLDITPLLGTALTAGTPYLIQWSNTGEVLFDMTFDNITWDADDNADDAGDGQVTFRGFYGRTHIDDETSGEEHLNLFLLANNTLYWPTDGTDPTAKMLGFRAYFRVNTSSPSMTPVYRGMPATLRIVATPTAIDEISSSLQGGDRGRLVLRNGLFIIYRNGESFSITGQKLL